MARDRRGGKRAGRDASGAARGARADYGTARGPGGLPAASRRDERARGGELDEGPAGRFGTWLASVFLAIGVLLLVLSVAGRGLPYLLGALDFLAVGGILLWAAKDAPAARAAD